MKLCFLLAALVGQALVQDGKIPSNKNQHKDHVKHQVRVEIGWGLSTLKVFKFQYDTRTYSTKVMQIRESWPGLET